MLSVCFYVSGLIAAPTPASGEYEALQELYSVNGKPAPEFKDGCYVSAGSEFECDANMLVSLTIYNQRLKEIPESIGKLVNLKSLNLNSNNLKTVPDSIGNLVNLTTLYLEENKLAAIPESIAKLTNLKELWLKMNFLPGVPEPWLKTFGYLHKGFEDYNPDRKCEVHYSPQNSKQGGIGKF